MEMMHPLNIEHPVCGYCGKALQVGEHLLILQDEASGEMFDAHAECHECALAEAMETLDELIECLRIH